MATKRCFWFGVESRDAKIIIMGEIEIVWRFMLRIIHVSISTFKSERSNDLLL